MKTNTAAVLLMSFSLGVLPWAARPAAAATTAQDTAFLRDAVRKMDAAAERKDAAGYTAFLHPDFVAVNLAGRETTGSRAEQP